MNKFIQTLKNSLILNAKNLIGWRTKRKIVVFSVDDYGNVRLHSREARENLDKAGFKAKNRFDEFDTLETRGDLEALYKVLTSVKDRNGRPAVFTSFAVPCNINFEKMAETGFKKYYYERLPETYKKLAELDPDSYLGAWDLWNEGKEKGLMAPQFHGREHINLKVLEEKLSTGDYEVLTSLKNRSYTGISSSGSHAISPLAAFDFRKFEDNHRFHNIIEDGLNQFENIFGYRAKHFTPPSYIAHPVLSKTLQNYGIRFMDSAMIENRHLGDGKYSREFNYTGKKVAENLRLMVRNVVFEPTDDRGVDWVEYAMKQIEAAFRWNRPAIISSHRVNFCGHIVQKNREEGLKALKQLLKKITKRWPEVEFMAANELGELIASEQQKKVKSI